MGARAWAVVLVILAILPFSAPFSTCALNDLAPLNASEPGRSLDDSVAPMAQATSLSNTGCPTVPRDSTALVPVAANWAPLVVPTFTLPTCAHRIADVSSSLSTTALRI